MTGVGTSGAAATVVNAFATGRGVAFGLGLPVTVRVTDASRAVVWDGARRLRPSEARLVHRTAMLAQQRLGVSGALEIRVRSRIPPRRGLKSSSAIAIAVAKAIADHAGARLRDRDILDLAAQANLDSGTSLTGAYDDAAACLLGGLVFTNNDRRQLLARRRLPADLVAWVRVPLRTVPTGTLRRDRFRDLAEAVDAAWRLARAGRIREAMLLNTCAYAPRLGLRPDFTFWALTRGAWAAGLSGKGPAEVALFRRGHAPRRPSSGRIRVVTLNPGGRA